MKMNDRVNTAIITSIDQYYEENLEIVEKSRTFADRLCPTNYRQRSRAGLLAEPEV